jgi:hypothetical protein
MAVQYRTRHRGNVDHERDGRVSGQAEVLHSDSMFASTCVRVGRCRAQSRVACEGLVKKVSLPSKREGEESTVVRSAMNRQLARARAVHRLHRTAVLRATHTQRVPTQRCSVANATRSRVHGRRDQIRNPGGGHGRERACAQRPFQCSIVASGARSSDASDADRRRCLPACLLGGEPLQGNYKAVASPRRKVGAQMRLWRCCARVGVRNGWISRVRSLSSRANRR